ncbi:50S ribosomal protein L24 [Alphaproteobacteria bacterium]|nr:50S ribosomal protein L24 [Alphaproteobacteria bacterium]
MKKFKIRRDDKVVVTAGRSKGKQGTIMQVLVDRDRVIIKDVNMVRRHTKASASSAGGIVEKEASIHISNVALVDPKDGKPTRVGFGVDKSGKKVRIAKRSGQELGS